MTGQGAQRRLRPFAIPPQTGKNCTLVQPQRWKCAPKLGNVSAILIRSIPDQQSGQ